MEEKIRKEYYQRVRAILKTEINLDNQMKTISTSAIPFVTNSFNIVNWTIPDIKKMDAKIHKLFTFNRMHHPKVLCCEE